jgi:hypothetical protein
MLHTKSQKAQRKPRMPFLDVLVDFAGGVFLELIWAIMFCNNNLIKDPAKIINLGQAGERHFLGDFPVTKKVDKER